MIALLAACRPGTAVVVSLEAEIAPSEHVEPAFTVAWEGPAGRATLWAVERGEASGELPRPGTWRALSREVEEGPSTLPLTLFPAGSDVRWRISVDTAQGRRWSPESEVRVPDAPAALGELDADGVLGDGGWLVAHRFTAAGTDTPSLAVVVDPAGEPVWWHLPEPGFRSIRARPSAAGDAILVLQDAEDAPDVIERVALDGSAIGRTVVGDASHDFGENGDGTFTQLVYEVGPPGTIRGVDAPVVSDALDRIREETGEAERIWGFFDDYPAEPAIPCGHGVPGEFVGDAAEWTHSNSLVRCPDDDGWLVVARHLDALLHLEDPVAEGVPAALTWQLGGELGTLRPEAAGIAFDHGHMSHAWRADDGLHVLLFDNRAHDPRPIVSRVVEYLVEPEAGRYRLLRQLPDPALRPTLFLGDARRLPSGATLVTWTPHDEVVAYDARGDETWRLRLSEPFGRTLWVSELRP